MLHNLLSLFKKFKDPASDIEIPWVKWAVRGFFILSLALTLYFASDRLPHQAVQPGLPVTNQVVVLTNLPAISQPAPVWKVQDFHLIEIISYISTVLAAGAGIWTYGVKPSIAVFSKIRNTYSSIVYISEQLRPNGGSSTYDTINRTAKLVELRGSIISQLESQTSKIYELLTVRAAESHLLMDESVTPMFECDITGGYTWTNLAFQKLFGLPATDMLGNGWLAALHPDDIREVYNNWNNTLRDWIPYRARYRVINVITKAEHLVEATAKVVKTSEGKPLLIIGATKPV